MGRPAVAILALAAAFACAGPSNAATLFLIQGGGWGHGVGLGQWGAEGFAMHGWNDRRILAHYYPHTTLATTKSPTIRVLLAGQQAHAAVGSRAPFLLVDARGRKVHVRRRTLHFGAGLRVGKQQLVPPVRVEPGASVLTYHGKGYRGTLTLLRSGGKLNIVNDVSMQMYLRGVVPSEMPRLWQPAAYEAQAIAARSYALAELRGTGDFDLYGDTRDQVYGGIRAERPATNAAVDATAGQVLTYDGSPILAYYSSSTGGRTEAVEDAFPGKLPVPYLVSVTDPYDTISPLHRWHVRLPLGKAARELGVGLTDIRVQHDAAGHAAEVELVGANGTTTVTGDAFAQTLGLRSSRFSVAALSLDTPTERAEFGEPYALQGFVRGVDRVSLQQLEPGGTWRLVGRVRAAPDGRFTIKVRPVLSTSYRLAVGHVAGLPVTVEVVPRLTVRATGNVVSGTIQPSVPLRVERQVGTTWRVVGRLPVGPAGDFTTKLAMGRYRITSRASRGESATSVSVIIVT